MTEPREVYGSEVKMLLSSGAILVDVREDEELRQCEPLPGHTHVPLSRLNDLPEKLPANVTPIFYCRSGARSFQAARIVARVYNRPAFYVAGGLLGIANAE